MYDKKFTHTWHYKLAHADNSFSLYFNDRLIAIILKPSSGSWPIHATINEKMYSFSTKGLLTTYNKNSRCHDWRSKWPVLKCHYYHPLFSTAKFVFSTW